MARPIFVSKANEAIMDNAERQSKDHVNGVEANMRREAAIALYEYLGSHENDIAGEMNDFGKLLVLFEVVMGHAPEKSVPFSG